MPETLFESNLAKFARYLAPVARRMPFDASYIRATTTREKEANIEHSFPLHSNYSAVKEAQNWLASLNLDGVEVLYVYGIGLGYYYEAILPWLSADRSRSLIYLEDDLGVLQAFLGTSVGSKILDNRQVQIHYFDSVAKAADMLDWLTTYFILQPCEISSLSSYGVHKNATFVELKKAILHETVKKAKLGSELHKSASGFYYNFFVNMLELPRAYHGNKLFGQFKGTPAIICGAGPSLEKHLSLLQSARESCLIFAGGSALNALSAAGVVPHFGAGIDPNLMQVKRLSTNHSYELPFFYRNRIHPAALSQVDGPRLYINGAGGYNIAEVLEKNLGIYEPAIEEGYNVVNFCMEIATHMGCSPIIFVGMDLAYTGNKSYASGVEEGSQPADPAAFVRPDIDGKPVYTLSKWIAESQWISSYAKTHPDVSFVNATEGGIGFPEVANQDFLSTLASLTTPPCDLAQRVHLEIQNAKFPSHLTESAARKSLYQLYESLMRAGSLCDQMQQEIERITKRIKEQKKQELTSPETERIDSLLIEEMAYKAVLCTSTVIHNKVLERKMHRIDSDPNLKSEMQRKLAKLALNAERFEGIRLSCENNAQIIVKAVAAHEAGRNA